MADLEKLARDYGSQFRLGVSRAVNVGLVMVYPDGRWTGNGPNGWRGPADGVRLGIDRSLG